MNKIAINILSLSSQLRAAGHYKLADELDVKFLTLKKAETDLYGALKETGEDLVDLAHPEGGVKMEDAKDEGGVVETIVEQKEKIEKAIKSEPTGKLSSKQILQIIKSARGDAVDKATAAAGIAATSVPATIAGLAAAAEAAVAMGGEGGAIATGIGSLIGAATWGAVISAGLGVAGALVNLGKLFNVPEEDFNNLMGNLDHLRRSYSEMRPSAAGSSMNQESNPISQKMIQIMSSIGSLKAEISGLKSSSMQVSTQLAENPNDVATAKLVKSFMLEKSRFDQIVASANQAYLNFTALFEEQQAKGEVSRMAGYLGLPGWREAKSDFDSVRSQLNPIVDKFNQTFATFAGKLRQFPTNVTLQLKEQEKQKELEGVANSFVSAYDSEIANGTAIPDPIKKLYTNLTTAGDRRSYMSKLPQDQLQYMIASTKWLQEP